MEGVGLWLIPIVMLLVVAGVVLLVRWWIRRSQEDMRVISTRMRQLTAELNQLQLAAQAFTADDPQPYSAPANQLYDQISLAAHQLQLHGELYASTRQSMRAAQPGEYSAVLRSPLAWFDIRRQINLLNRQANRLDEALQAATASVGQLEKMGWQTAEHTRSAHQRLERASELAQELRERGVQGEAYQSAIRSGAQLRAAIQTIPAYFFTDEAESVLEQADKETVIEVEALLEENRPLLEDLLGKMQTWKNQHEQASAYIEAFRKAIDELRSAIAEAPPGLVLERAEQRADQLEQTAADLRHRLAAPQAENLRGLLQEARTSARTAQSDVQALSIARQQIGELQTVLNSLNALLTAVDSKVRELEQSERYPVRWDASREPLADLQEQASALGPADQPRMPEEVGGVLARGQALREGAHQLEQAVAAAAQRYTRLVPLLESLDPKSNTERFANMRRLAAQLNDYSADNWPRADAAASYAADVAHLLEQVQQLMPPEPAAPLAESRVGAQLELAADLSERYQAINTRTENIGRRLSQLQAQESEAEIKLGRLNNLFHQVELLAQSNPVLAQAARRSENERLWQEGQRLSDELFKREKRLQGLVERKTQRVDLLTRRAEIAAAGWLAKLETEVTARRNELADKLDRLNRIANLDDPVLSNAAQLVDELKQTLPASPARGSSLPLDQAMTAIKGANDDYQRLNSALQGVENEIENEVIQTYENALDERQRSLLALEQASSWLPDTPAWPPTTQSLDDARQALDEVEGRWDAVHAEPLRANRLIMLLGEITRGYQAVSDLAERTLERAESERDRIRMIELTINDALAQWQVQAAQHAGSPETQEAIQDLLEETQLELDGLQRDYAHGRKSYQDTEQQLKAVQRRLAATHVPVEGGGRIDIRGETRIG